MSRGGIEVTSNARLHLTLFSMHEGGLRINGGIGFSVDSPNITVRAGFSNKFCLLDKRQVGLSELALCRLQRVLRSAVNECNLPKDNILIEISGQANANYGFGTGTAIRLACIEALMLLNDCTLSKDKIIRLSERGGTSGIGINSYFTGGLVVDLGVQNHGQRLQSSSQTESTADLPLLLQQTKMPSWDVGICIPPHIPPLSEKEETDFFIKTCPINESESHKALYHSIIGVYAAVSEGKKEAFDGSIRAIQQCAWKKAERGLHGNSLLLLENDLYNAGATAVGMSSLGPSLFFLAKDVRTVIASMQENHPTCQFLVTKPVNKGRHIRCLS